MDKRYQVFISSTYTDLREERQLVSQTLMELNCIPAGMELFPATDEEQFSFIKTIIDDSDYYLLIIGGRYGSVTEEGVSYTEKEYDYAVEQGKPVVALLHRSPSNLSMERSEATESARSKLNSFRDRVSTGRLVRHWNSAQELQALVAVSMVSTIARIPAVGWVRGSAAASEDLLIEINDLRKKNETLSNRIKKYESTTIELDFEAAGFDMPFTIHGTYISSISRKKSNWSTEISWREIFYYISPYLTRSMIEKKVSDILSESLVKKISLHTLTSTLDSQDFQTISIQLKVLGVVNIDVSRATDGKRYKFWSLTSAGEKLMYQLRVLRSNKEQQELPAELEQLAHPHEGQEPLEEEPLDNQTHFDGYVAP